MLEKLRVNSFILFFIAIFVFTSCGNELKLPAPEDIPVTETEQKIAPDITEETKPEIPKKEPVVPSLVWYKYDFIVEDKEFEVTPELALAWEVRNCAYNISAKDEEGEAIAKEEVIKPKGLDYISELNILESKKGFSFDHSRDLNLQELDFSGNCLDFEPTFIKAVKTNPSGSEQKFFFQRKVDQKDLIYALGNLLLFSYEKLELQEEDSEKGIPCSSISIFHNNTLKAKVCLQEGTDGYYRMLDFPADFRPNFETESYTITLNYINNKPTDLKLINKTISPHQAQYYLASGKDEYSPTDEYTLDLYRLVDAKVDLANESLYINASTDLTVKGFTCTPVQNSELEYCQKKFTPVNSDEHISLQISTDLERVLDQVLIKHFKDSTKSTYYTPMKNKDEIDDGFILRKTKHLSMKIVGADSEKAEFTLELSAKDSLAEKDAKEYPVNMKFEEGQTEVDYLFTNLDNIPLSVGTIWIQNNRTDENLNFKSIKIKNNRRTGEVSYFPLTTSITAKPETQEEAAKISEADSNSLTKLGLEPSIAASAASNKAIITKQDEYKLQIESQNIAGDSIELILFEQVAQRINLSNGTKTITFNEWLDFDENVDMSLIKIKSNTSQTRLSAPTISKMKIDRKVMNVDSLEFKNIKDHLIERSLDTLTLETPLSSLCQPGSFFNILQIPAKCQACNPLEMKYQEKAGGTECKKCDNDYVGPKADTCSACPAGMDCTKGFLAKVCSAGTFCIAGKLEPEICPVGYFCPEKTLLDPSKAENADKPCLDLHSQQGTLYNCKELQCPKGYYCIGGTKGAVEKVFTGEGSILDIHKAWPETSKKCPKNQYQDQKQKTSCKLCPKDSGTWNIDRTESLIARTNAEDCIADPGFWKDKGDDNKIKALTVCTADQYEFSVPTTISDRICEYCPEGYYCDTKEKFPCPIHYSCASKASLQDYQNREFVQDPSLESARVIPCPAGKDCSKTESKKGKEPSCPAEHFCLEASDPQPWAPLCSTGEYVKVSPDAKTNRVCEICPAGKWCTTTDTPQHVERQKCQAGHYCPEGSTAKTGAGLCSAGYYCPEGSETSQGSFEGSRSEKVCKQGYYCPEGSSTEEGSGLCKAGYYCPEGSYTEKGDSLELAEEKKCRAGNYCPEGSFNEKGVTNDDSNEKECAAGRYCPEGSATERGAGRCTFGHYCPMGSINNKGVALADPNVKLCSPGHYCTLGAVNSFGGTADAPNTAKECTPGYYCPKGAKTRKGLLEGDRSSRYCSPGYYCGARSYSSDGRVFGSQDGTQEEEAYAHFCKEGFYCPQGSRAENGSTEKKPAAKVCPADHYCTKGTRGINDDLPATNLDSSQEIPGFANKCPTGSSSIAGSTKSDACLGKAGYILVEPRSSNNKLFDAGESFTVVEAGYYSPANSNVKTLCPPGLFCLEGAETDTGNNAATGIKTVNCPAGTYNKHIGDDDIVDCEPCGKGYYCPTPGLTERTPCSAGEYQDQETATTCKSVSPGYYIHNRDPANVALPLNREETPTECPAGSYCLGGDHNLEPCPKDHYCFTRSMQREVDNRKVFKCPNNSETLTFGKSEPSDCISLPGAYLVDRPQGLNPVNGVYDRGEYFADCEIGNYCFGGLEADGTHKKRNSCVSPFESEKPGLFITEQTKSTSISQCIPKCPPNSTWTKNQALVNSLGYCLPIPKYYLKVEATNHINKKFDLEEENEQFSLCDAGYYCPGSPGTNGEEYIADPTKASNQRIDCPENHWCPAGVSEPIACINSTSPKNSDQLADCACNKFYKKRRLDTPSVITHPNSSKVTISYTNGNDGDKNDCVLDCIISDINKGPGENEFIVSMKDFSINTHSLYFYNERTKLDDDQHIYDLDPSTWKNRDKSIQYSIAKNKNLNGYNVPIDSSREWNGYDNFTIKVFLIKIKRI